MTDFGRDDVIKLNSFRVGRQLKLQPSPILVLVLHTPALVHLRVQREALHEQRREEPERCDPDHHPPHDDEALCERVFDLAAEGLFERRDHGDDRVRDRHAAGELFDERRGEFLAELGLEDGGADGDAPYLEIPSS